MKTVDDLIDDILEKDSSIAYPKDLGFWGLESNKIDELKRHFSRFKVELKGTYISKEEFPALVKKYPPSQQEIDENKDLEKKGEELIESSLLEIELKSTAADAPKVMKVLKDIRAFPLEEHHISNLKKREMEELFDEQSSIDPYAAVLMAHTKNPEHNSKAQTNALKDITSYMKSKGAAFSPEFLDKLLTFHGLKLRSAHPDALKNLYNNLMKIRPVDDKKSHYNTGLSGVDTADEKDDKKVKDLANEEKSEDIGIKGIASQILREKL
jgi:hypothetical protein